VTPRRLRLLRGLLVIAALVALGFALVRATEDAGQVPLPGMDRLAVAGALLAVGMAAATSAWSRLLPDVRFSDVLPGYSLAQLAKYIPGSVWQGVGQVADAQRFGVPATVATVAFVAQSLLQVTTAATVGALALLAPELPGWLIVCAAAGPLTLLLLDRRWLAAAMRRLAAVSRRLDPGALEPPSQGALIAAAVRCIVCILALAGGFVVLLPGSLVGGDVAGAIGVFALAWVIGFVLIPLPAGLGVREFVLVVGLAGSQTPADVLTASVVARLLLIVVEGGYAGVAQLARLPRTRPRRDA
jgi:glycosyltransferase 2 family protein